MYQPQRPRLHHSACFRASRSSGRPTFDPYHIICSKWSRFGVETIRDASQFFNDARYAARQGHLRRIHATACLAIFVQTLPIEYQDSFSLHLCGTSFPIVDDHPRRLSCVFDAIKKTFPIRVTKSLDRRHTEPLPFDQELETMVSINSNSSPLDSFDFLPQLIAIPFLDSEEVARSPYQVRPRVLQPPDTGSGSFSCRSIPLGYTDSPASLLHSETPCGSLPNNIRLTSSPSHTYQAETNISMDSDASTIDLAARNIDYHRQPSAMSRSSNNPLPNGATLMEVTPTLVKTTKIMRSWPWDETLDFLDPTLPATSQTDFITGKSDGALCTDSESNWNELVKLTKEIYEFSSIVCAMDINGRFIHAWVTENDSIHSLMRSITIHQHLDNFTLLDRVKNLRNIAIQLEMYAAVAKHENDRTGNTQVTLLPSEPIPTWR